MTALEEMAASALVDSADVCEVLALVRASAEALADMDPRERGAARLQVLATEIAVTKAQLDLLAAVIGERARAGDHRGALLADKLATGAARRLAILCSEHRAGARTVIAVAHAESVRIE